MSEGGTTTTSTTYTWDRRGLPRSEAQTILGTAYTVSFGTDANGNRTRVTYPSSRVVTYTFDFADRPLSAVSGATTYVSSVAYEPFGPEKSLAFGNGTTRTAAWNERYQPDALGLTGGSVGAAVSYTYALDALGNITGLTDNGNVKYNRAFGYDDLNRLTTATTPTTGRLPSLGHGDATTTIPSATGRRSPSGARSATYAYDVVAGKTTSRLASTTEGGPSPPSFATVPGTRRPSAQARRSISSRNALSASGLSAFRYDARGVRVAEEVASGSGLYTITPCRLLDTRNPDGPYGGPNIPAGGSRTFTSRGSAGSRAAARAVALNVTVAGPSTTGFRDALPVGRPAAGLLDHLLLGGEDPGQQRAAVAVPPRRRAVFNSSRQPTPRRSSTSRGTSGSPRPRAGVRLLAGASLLAETTSATSTPAPLYEYVWLGGKPSRRRRWATARAFVTPSRTISVRRSSRRTRPGRSTWRVEHEPFGSVYGYRVGTASDHQPLRSPRDRRSGRRRQAARTTSSGGTGRTSVFTHSRIPSDLRVARTCFPTRLVVRPRSWTGSA